jgi:dTDP-4-amino-4,6-dideoxy-D-galactose acyltransferase
MAAVSDPATTSPCEVLEWDSEHFGFPIARITAARLTDAGAEAADEWCREQGIRCLYLCSDFVDAESARVAAAHGFRVVDVRVVSRRSYEGLSDLPVGPDELTLREGVGSDVEFARELAARSHHASRFYFDGGFPRDRCDALYRAWIDRGDRDPERRLLIPVVGGEPVGYIVCAPVGPDREAQGELVAIAEQHRGKGYGWGMSVREYRYQAARGATSHKGVMSLRSVANIRLHERLGFVTDEVEVWHHKWYGSS